jgi:hypothetical protein
LDWFRSGSSLSLYSHALKARINSKDAVAKALKIAYKELKTHIEMRESDLDQEIKVDLNSDIYFAWICQI